MELPPFIHCSVPRSGKNGRKMRKLLSNTACLVQLDLDLYKLELRHCCGSRFVPEKAACSSATYHGSRACGASALGALDSFLCNPSSLQILGVIGFKEEEQQGSQPLDLHSSLVDLESFSAWSLQIKLDMSWNNPLLYKVFDNIAYSKDPIEGGENFQAESKEASFFQGMSHQNKGVDREKEARELQISREGRELGCLLVQRTQGETQLQVTKRLVATNGWETWRQLNLSFLSRLLESLLHMSFGGTPASFLQQLLAWKKRVVIYQALSGEKIPDTIMMSVVLGGLKGQTGHYPRLRLDGDSSFSDLENLLATLYAEQESSLKMIADRACTDKPAEKGERNRVNDQGSNHNLQQKQEQDKQQKLARGKRKGTP